MSNFVLGQLNGFAIDLGGTKLAAARIEKGKIVQKEMQPTQSGQNAQEQCAAMKQLLAKVGWQGAPVSIAVAGRITASGEWSAVNKGTLPEIDTVPFVEVAKEILQVPIALYNDAAAAAFAEAHFGAGQNANHFAFITVSTGIGGGIVLNGKPLKSDNGLAGHIGFMTSRIATDLCGSGRKATVESIAGGRAILATARQLGKDVESAKQVYDAALNEEQWATDIIDRSAQAIAILCADLRALLGTDKVAIGGSIGLAPNYIQKVDAFLADEPVLFRPEIRPVQLGHDSALIGALAMSREAI
jgi:N-acylmannosamine kinase